MAVADVWYGRISRGAEKQRKDEAYERGRQFAHNASPTLRSTPFMVIRASDLPPTPAPTQPKRMPERRGVYRDTETWPGVIGLVVVDSRGQLLRCVQVREDLWDDKEIRWWKQWLDRKDPLPVMRAV